jgi:DNA-binding NtrC family response regulator
MHVETLIFEPPECQFGELRREFHMAAPRDWDIRLVSTVDELFDRLRSSSVDHLVVLPHQIDDSGRSGTELIAPIRELDQETPIVITADTGNVMSVAQAIDAGASDFFVRGERLRERIATLLGKLNGLFEVIERNRLLREDNASLREAIQAKARMVGNSPQIRQLLDQIRRVAPVPRPVLIVGERGTGKELVARAIHFAGEQSTRPIVTVNCAAFNDALLESELFGHEKGAFTGADSARAGKFEQANHGTLFLDEIGHMSLPFQEKILRVVEYGTYARVGGTTDRSSSCRIIAATNRDLHEMISKGEFLADLHDRLAFETILVPPLRERQGDVAVLSQYFLDQFARETPAFGGKRLSAEALGVLGQHPFAGNVRELKNLIERAAYRDTTSEITSDDLGLLPHIDLASRGGSFYEKLNAFGQQLIADALGKAGGNQTQASRQLGLSYHQFRYYRKKYGAE